MQWVLNVKFDLMKPTSFALPAVPLTQPSSGSNELYMCKWRPFGNVTAYQNHLAFNAWTVEYTALEVTAEDANCLSL